VYQTKHRLPSLIYDAQTAFLHGELNEPIYMECPEGMEHEEDEVLLLEKTIYGLVQSSRQYFLKFRNTLLRTGFQQCPSDPCLFKRQVNGQLLFINVYIDDNFCVGNMAGLKWIIEEVPKQGFKITVEWNTDVYLSCQIIIDDKFTLAWVEQPHFIRLQQQFGEETTKGLQKYRTPGTPGQGLVMAKEQEEVIQPEKHADYRTGTGMLLYSTKTRPVICNPVRELSKVLSAPNEAAYKEMLRAIKYTLDTPNKGLKVKPHNKD